MVGKLVNQYKIVKLIGEGGMGNVYLAEHATLARPVAIKALHRAHIENASVRARFRNEAATLAQLKHPGIVSLFDYVEQDDGVFLIMEYVEGTPLDRYVQRVSGPLPEQKVVDMMRQILRAVAYAHHRGVIHRDLKPSNIMVTPELELKILDFGIAKVIGQAEQRLTQTGSKVGTVFYMSPEQVRNQPIDIRTDIYSLGVTLFEMMAGRSPYEELNSEYDVYERIVKHPLPRAQAYYPPASERLQRVVDKATAKDPRDRFASCAAFEEALLEPDPGPRMAHITDHGLTVARGQRRRLGRWAWAIGALVLVVAAGAGLWLRFKPRPYFVAAHRLVARQQPDPAAPAVWQADFGALLLLRADAQPDAQGWVLARLGEGGRGQEAFVPSDALASPEELALFKQIFGEFNFSSALPLGQKRALVEHFRLRGEISRVDGMPYWTSSSAGHSDFEPFATADFDGNASPDMAHMLQNPLRDQKLLLLRDQDPQRFDQIAPFPPDWMARLAPASQGRRWFLGNERVLTTVWGRRFVEPILEPLPYDAIELYDVKADASSLLIFSKPEGKFVIIPQKQR